MKTKPIIRNFLTRAAMTLGGRQAVTLAGVMTRRFTVMITLLLMMATAWAVKPTTNLDVCRGEAYSIYVRGWAFDKDAPDFSLSVKVYVYKDAACKNQYAYKKLYTGYVERPDVVTVHSLPSGSKPGFEGRIPITDPGTYYVKVYAIDIDNEGENITNSSTEMSNSFNPVTVTTLTTIGSAADWNTFVTVIKSGEDFAGKTLTLTADIPTAEEIAAGTTAVTTITSEEKAFCGTFDGQGHTINVDLNTSGNTATGLFSYVKGATIKDLTVTGTINNTGLYAGGLVGTAKGATIQNCTLAATINSSGNEIGAFVGGCSQIDANTPGNLTLQDCIFSGSIHITGSYGDSKSAGLVSVWNNTSLTISNCLVKGSFSSERSGAQFYPIAFKNADATVTANVSETYYLNTLPVTTSGENFIPGAKGKAVSTTYVEDQWDIPVTAADGSTYYEKSISISSAADWNAFAAAVTNGNTYEGKIVKLTADIPTAEEIANGTTAITTTAGESFEGIFNGCGHTITVNLSGGDGVALFTYLDGATIQYVRVDGTVTSDYMFPSTFAKFAKNTNITSCWSNVEIVSNRAGQVNGGALVAQFYKGSLCINDCAFTGSVSYNNGGYYGGGMVGWVSGEKVPSPQLRNCLFAPSSLTGGSGDKSYVFVSGYARGTLNKCYYNAVAASSALQKEGTDASSMSNEQLLTAFGSRWEIREGKVVPIMNPKNLSIATLNGIQTTYYSQNGPISIDYTLTAADGKELTKDLHYTATITNSSGQEVNTITDADFYTLTITGKSPYIGTITKRFAVVGSLLPDENGTYLINKALDWESFAYSVNNGLVDCSGKTVKLMADISITNAVGTNDHPFCGTFDGQGHTLTVDMSDTENQGTAPFRYIRNANIWNVKTEGSVSGNMHCAGLVGFAQSGNNTIKNCVVAVDVNSNGSHCGGILGHGTSSNTTIRNCLFSGSISGATSATGIIYGWGDNGTHTIENCLSAGTYSGGGIELIHSGNTQTITNCYRKTTGGSQGTDASKMSNDELAAALGAGWRISNNQVVPIMDSKNIGLATVSGIDDYYLYTGSAINIDYTVTAIDGTPLTKGTNYTETISPSTVLAKGDYTLTITGKAPYTGSQTFHFTVGDGRPVTFETTTMTTGPYRVTEDVTIESRITINGEVTLILDEGVTLNALCGIGVESGNTLTIEGTGTLRATGNNTNAGIGGTANYNSDSEHGHIIINSGTIIAKGGDEAAGIGGGWGSTAGSNSIIEINGGVVYATGGDEKQIEGIYYTSFDITGAGIGGGYQGGAGIIIINGGQVTARGQQDYAPGIGVGYHSWRTPGSLTLGWTKTSDFIDVDNYDIGSISFAEGKTFFISGDWNTVATVENIGGKKIVPPGYRNNVASATIGSLQDYYVYSGSAFSISYSVVGPDNTPLTEGTHYTTELRNSSGVAINKTNGSYQLTDMGSYTLTFTGINSYGGTIEKRIVVVPPTPNLTMGDWNHQEATLTWQSPNVDATLTGYAYQYKKTNEWQWSPITSLPASSTSVTLNGLSPVTSYDFRVKAVYGDYESLYQSVSFTTGVEIPYDCGFENGMDGWVTHNVYSIWSKIRNTEKYEGEYSFDFPDSDIYPIQYLISPRFSADVISVSFHYKGEWYNSKLQVGYSTTTNDISAFTWGDVVDVPLSWQLYEQDFPKGTRYVAIKADFSNDGSDIFVDDFHFMDVGIKKPANFAVGEITKTSATVTWSAPSTTLAVAGYAYQYKRANDGGWSDETTTTATSVTISNLAPSTTYQVRVKTLYASGESLYETADFTTIVALPYTDGFENGIGGWTIVDGYYALETLYTGISSHGKRNGDNGFEFFHDKKNQYLISPQLEGAAPMMVSFYYAKDNDGYEETFQVGYSTTTSDISAFIWGDMMIATSTQWQKYENTFPEGTKYIAFKYVYEYDVSQGNLGTVRIFTDNWRMYLDDFSFAYVPASVTFAKEGYGTYYNGSLDAVLPTGVKAYIVTASSGGGSLTYQTIADGDSETKTVLAGTAVMLQTKASNSTRIIEIPLESPSANSISETNLLHGSDVAVETSGGGNGAEYYRLSYDTNGKKAGWYWGAADGAAFTSAAHEAWLALPAGAGAGGFLMLPGVGDANGNGKVDAADIVEMVNAMNGNVSTNFNWNNADFDGNHTITDYDINEVVKIIMGEQ